MPAPRLIEWTGERCVPWVEDSAMLYEHFHRYLWVAQVVSGRRVLDLGSGEGFGAAILAGTGADVTGVDLDAAAVEHAGTKYGSESLRFVQASAADLSHFGDASFTAVVAFEMIEHVRDHELVLAEIDRVLARDGLLFISTPDRDLYSQATGQVNTYHEHELTQGEFRELLGRRFSHVAMWGQQTMTGSHLRALDPAKGTGRDFIVSRDEDGLHELADPPALFCVAVASHVDLPDLGPSSTLADYGLELLHETARAHARSVAERDRLLGEVNQHLADANRMLDEKRVEVLAVAAKLTEVETELLAMGAELKEAREYLNRVDDSILWRALERARSTLYHLLDERSLAARGLRTLRRLLKRAVFRRTPI